MSKEASEERRRSSDSVENYYKYYEMEEGETYDEDGDTDEELLLGEDEEKEQVGTEMDAALPLR